MPFSFIEIEEKKSRVIFFVFLFIVLFYFIDVYIVLFVVESFFRSGHGYPVRGLDFLPSLKHTLAAFLFATFAGILHWIISVTGLIEKMSFAAGALPVDLKDTYHQTFQNIVDEVSVAIGGRPIEAVVISSVALNAFSLEDFNGRAVIGVTEGLLSRLNRSQIEAVVAHEAGHIVSGDCLPTTVTSSLSEIHEEMLSKLLADLRGSGSRGGAFSLFLFLFLALTNFISKSLRYFVSRQREYRADAISVRLTRNPLALAEALKLISRNWHGAGCSGEKLESIFIVNPRFDHLDDEEGIIPDTFSTHPPLRKRVEVLLGMAHMDEKVLDESLKNFQRVSPVAKAEFKTADEETGTKKWSVFKEQNWLGPFLLEDLKKIDGIRPDQWVKLEGQDKVIPAYDDSQLREGLFGQSGEKEDNLYCPHCKVTLIELNYEGVPVYKCSYCAGVFVQEHKVSRIFTREDLQFSPETTRLAQQIIDSKDKHRLIENDAKPAWVISCPKCKKLMRRQFFVYSYPVEIDRCFFCSGIWFDKQELEILQYLYQHKEEFFDGKNF